jgi:MFS family permease
MVILDTTVVNVAFQALREEFGGDISSSQWILSVYVLALGITTPLAGFLADRFGSKRIYLGSLTLFLAGSALSLTAYLTHAQGGRAQSLRGPGHIPVPQT